MNKIFRVLILGGYGNFGKIIAKKLTEIEGVEVIIAGRDVKKVAEFSASLNVESVVMDVTKDDLAKQFIALNLDLVISTVGPFQGQNYAIVRAAIAAKIHYIDLADGREFVENITMFNEEALEQGLFICSGASSFPGLSSAVIDEFIPRFSKLDSIDIGISSSEKVPGISTLSAVLSYCGKPFTMWINREWKTVYGLQNLRRHHFIKIDKKRWLFNANVPDLSLFPEHYPSVSKVTFAAGVGLTAVQLGSWGLSWLARAKIFTNPQKIVRFLHKSAQRLEFLGDGLSALYITLEGNDQKREKIALTWEIIARDNDGPNIPCFAAIALTRKLHNQTLTKRGAFSSIGLLTLDEYLAELHGLNIETYFYIDEY